MVRILYVLGGETKGGIAAGLRGLVKHLSPQWKAHVISAPRKNGAAFLEKLIRTKKIQIVQSCDAAIDAALAAYHARIPHVWFVGGLVEATCDGASREALQTYQALMTRLSDTVVVPSRALARAQFPHLSPQRLRVIPWGVESVRPASTRIRNRLRKKLGVGPWQPLVAMVGNFYPAKRHLDFLETASRIRRTQPYTRFLIAGRCVGVGLRAYRKSCAYRAHIRQAVPKRGLRNILKLTSFPPQDRSAWLSAIDLLLVPSEEGMSQAMLEAMACGIPVVAANVGGNPEVIQHRVSGWLVPYQNPRAMAKATAGIIDNPALTKRLAQAGQRRVLSGFSAAQQAKRFQHLYEMLLTRKP